ncbi:MAG: hypothetical protein GDA55_08615 [Cellvibrionales bacterium]|nr:hypothetical protein [Cellvibrionales bacterium]
MKLKIMSGKVPVGAGGDNRAARFACGRALCGVFIALACWTGPAKTQEIIIQDEPAATGARWDDWFFGSVGGFFASSSSVDRRYASVRLGLDVPLQNGQVFMEGLLVNREVSIEQKLEGFFDPDDDSIERTREISVDDSYAELGDFYGRYSLLSNLEVVGGRQRVIWGQLDIASPVNFLLPLQFQNRELILGKASQRVPQDHLSLFWYPSERWEVQAVHFFATRIDDLLVETVTEVADRTRFQFDDEMAEDITATDFRIERGQDDPESLDISTLKATGLVSRTEDIAGPDLEDHSQNALRILYRPDWGTVGLTYKTGRYNLYFEDFARLTGRRYSYDNTDPDRPAIIEAYDTEMAPDLGESDAFGLEIAIPRNRWTYKFELVYQDAWYDDLLGYGGQEFLYERVGDSDTYALTETGGIPQAEWEARARLYDRVLNENDGALYFPLKQTLMAVGADADLDKWRFNLSLLAIMDDFDSALGEELYRLAEEAGLEEDFDVDDLLVIPVINVARYLEPDKNRYIGGALGFFGSFAGVSVFYNQRIGDNFRWQAGLEFIQDGGSDLISDANDEGGRYDLADEAAGGFHIGFVYDF